MNRDASKPRCWQVHITKYFAHSQLASAGFHGRGMVVVNSEAAGHIGSSNGGPVTQRKDSIHPQVALRFKHDFRGSFRRFEMNGDGAVAPGVFPFVRTGGDK